jgi:hypothetical protein
MVPKRVFRDDKDGFENCFATISETDRHFKVIIMEDSLYLVADEQFVRGKSDCCMESHVQRQL